MFLVILETFFPPNFFRLWRWLLQLQGCLLITAFSGIIFAFPIAIYVTHELPDTITELTSKAMIAIPIGWLLALICGILIGPKLILIFWQWLYYRPENFQELPPPNFGVPPQQIKGLKPILWLSSNLFAIAFSLLFAFWIGIAQNLDLVVNGFLSQVIRDIAPISFIGSAIAGLVWGDVIYFRLKRSIIDLK